MDNTRLQLLAYSFMNHEEKRNVMQLYFKNELPHRHDVSDIELLHFLHTFSVKYQLASAV